MRTGRGLFTLNTERETSNGVDQADTLQTDIEPPEAVVLVAAPIVTPPTSKPSQKNLSFADAAERVLQKFADRKPMHYRQITNKATELGLIESSSETPEVVMYAVIAGDIQRRTKRGELPRFVQLGRGLVGLTEWEARDDTEQSLATLIEQHNKQIRSQLHEQIRQMKPSDFEGLVGRLLTALGFESVSVTKLSGDGGIDVMGVLVVGDVVRIRMAVQAKRWRNNVQAPIVQGLRGSLGVHDQGLIITTSDFSRGAREEAMRPNAIPIALMDGEQLVKLLIENDIGIRRSKHDLIELGEVVEEEIFEA